MDIEFLAKRNEVESIWSFDFKKPSGIQFDAGDYVELALEYGENKLGGRRWYTIASAPYETMLTFTTVITEVPSEFKNALLHLQPGQSATISPPIGTFNLPRNDKQKLLWIAGGIGVTPFRSMAREVIKNHEKREVQMLYVAKPNRFIYQPELRSVCNKLETTSISPEIDRIIQLFPDYLERSIYLSGPQEFCENYYEEFKLHGVEKNQLNLDYFPGYSQI